MVIKIKNTKVKTHVKILSKNSSKPHNGKYELQIIKINLGRNILVMIGILPALQVNNWNQDRSNRRIEKKYLESLGNEYLVNEKNLDQSLMYMDNKMSEYKI